VYVVVGDGAAPAILRAGDRDVPYVKRGAQLTVREALTELARGGDVGTGGLIALDSDGRVLG
jgi:hypothetical protein